MSALQVEKKKTLQDRMTRRPVGVTRRTIRWLLRQLSEAQRIHQGLERLDDPTLPDRMFRRLRRKRGNDSKGLVRLGGL